MNATPPIDVPVIDTDPYSDEVIDNPYPFYDELRDAGPVVWLSKYGIFSTGRYDEVKEVMASNDVLISGRGVGLEDVEAPGRFRPPSVILEADGEEHARIRKAFMNVLSPKLARALKASWSEQIDRIVAEAVERGTVDLIPDLAYRVPLEVVVEEVGFTGEPRSDLIEYGAAVFNSMGPANELGLDGREQGGVYQPWIDANCQRDALRPGGLGEAIWGLADSGQVSEREAALLVRTFYAAGVDSSVTGLGNALQALASAPDQWQKLHADPSLARFAAEESLRFTSVVQQFHRVAVEDVSVGGVVIPAGSRIAASMGAANRDPRRWGEDADRLVVTRQASGQLAFGAGRHLCAGMGLARLQMEATLTSLATRVSEIRLLSEPVLRRNNSVRSWKSVPVELIPA